MNGTTPSKARTTTPPGTDPTVTPSIATVESDEPAPVRLRYLVTAAVVPLVLLVIWGALLTSGSAVPPGGQVGSLAPRFALADLDGQPIRLADLHGRPVIVNFWASSCAPCVDEFPLLAAALERYRGDGLAVVGIVYRDRSEAAREFMLRMGAAWPAAMDPGEMVATAYGVFGPPESYFIGRDGRVAGRQIGQLSEADLQRQLSLILGKE